MRGVNQNNIISLALLYILKACVATNSIRGRQSPDKHRFEREVNEHHEGRWIIGFKSGAGFDSIDRQMQSDADPRRVMGLPQDRAEVMTLSSEEEVQYWNDREDVAYVEPDYIVRPLAETIPYGISAVKALSVNDDKVSNQKVCIIDTGYDINHPDLPSSSNIVSGNSQIRNESWSTDGDGHGTHIAGTIAALGGNGRGVVGVNRNGQVKLHIIKIFDNNGDWAYTSDLIKAAEQCVEAGSTIINMSLGGNRDSVTERNALNRIYNEENVLLVAASGNDGSNKKLYPASYPSVISVAAVDSAKKKAWFSQFNEGVDLAAPGVGIESTYKDGRYFKMNGTSMASPHVAGVAALVWSHFPNLTAKDIRKALESSAEDLGQSGKDFQFGYGLVRADRAYTLLLGDGGGTEGGNGNTCVDSPAGWYDSDGPTFTCQWYKEKDNCDSFGSTNKYSNFGKNAKQACCACGGGSTALRPPAPTPTKPEPTPIPPTESPTESPTKRPTSSPTQRPSPTPKAPSPTSPTRPSKCFDSPLNWNDSDGPTFTCKWYADYQYCEQFGDGFPNFGKTANQACCACGGGRRINDASPVVAPTAPSAPLPSPPSNETYSCGCSTCGESILNEVIGRNGFKLGEQIGWLQTHFGYTETRACRLLCGQLFEDKCSQCNPSTCSRR